MTGIDLDRAKTHLEAWLEAELAVTTGQSYSLGSRSLTRANLSEIRKQIQFWRNQVSKLSGKSRRVVRVVPRDF
ncbi:DUF6148 family protein [Neobacillus mesonae]|uniref:DUF6148 family protein n=1 Tax=Neobacillus mesonae TaxID=1193713 RepID=UPI00203D85A1|nr:DUF6148 family protein [Neobacillus mesonae]MCM3567861.1 DUF6148 family protein [Neobacillus mesonae]